MLVVAAQVALEMGPGFAVFPIFCENGEEMKWCFLADFFAFLRIEWVHALILTRQETLDFSSHWIMGPGRD